MYVARWVAVLVVSWVVGCGDNKARDEAPVNIVQIDPPKISIKKPDKTVPGTAVGRCQKSDDCRPGLKCILKQCRTAPCTKSVDTGGDGTVENRVEYTYNADGKVRKIDRTEGEKRGGVGFEFNGKGKVISAVATTDGRVTSRTAYTYSEADQLVSKTVERNGRRIRSTMTYDTAGRKTSLSVDTTGDGKVNRLERYTYDKQGNLLSRENVNPSNNQVIVQRSFTYDAHDHVLSEKLDKGADGNIEESTTYKYDKKGNEIVREWTRVAPTLSNQDTFVRWEFTRDAEGNVLIWDILGPQKVLKDRTTYAYNDRGDVMTEDVYTVSGGQVAGVAERTEYSYGPQRNLLKEEKFDVPRKRIKERITYTYACWGSRTPETSSKHAQ